MSAPWRRKVLSREDEDVWRAVTRTLKPLKSTKAPATHAALHQRSHSPDIIRPRTPAPAGQIHAEPAPITPHKPPPRIQSIDESIRRKLARGRLRPDMKLDLHGLRQHEAHEELLGFLRRARRSGARIVLVVTGKGRGSAPDHSMVHPGGVLQRMVRHWLAAPELRDHVIGFDEADPSHGGSGALFVRVRRDREAGHGERESPR